MSAQLNQTIVVHTINLSMIMIFINSTSIRMYCGGIMLPALLSNASTAQCCYTWKTDRSNFIILDLQDFNSNSYCICTETIYDIVHDVY